MLIGEIIKKTGLSKDTIRFYEKMGLIKVPQKARRENNYKEYPEAVLKKLSVIQKLKGFGFTLNEIDEIIRLYEADIAKCPENLPKVHDKINAIDEKIKQLEEVKQKLMECVKDCTTTSPGCCQLDSALSGLKQA